MSDPASITLSPAILAKWAAIEAAREAAGLGPDIENRSHRSRCLWALSDLAAAIAALAQPARAQAGVTDGLRAAIRAAKLALFVINKQNVMPNSSWRDGFDKDLALAENALAALNGGE